MRLGITQSVVNKRKAKILAKLRKSCYMSAPLIKQPLSKSVQTTGQTLTLTEGFTVGQVILLKMQGHFPTEIAPVVHLTTGAVYARLSHLRKKLQKIL